MEAGNRSSPVLIAHLFDPGPSDDRKRTPAPFVSDSEAANAIAETTGGVAMSDAFVNVDLTSLADLRLDF